MYLLHDSLSELPPSLASILLHLLNRRPVLAVLGRALIVMKQLNHPTRIPPLTILEHDANFIECDIHIHLCILRRRTFPQDDSSITCNGSNNVLMIGFLVLSGNHLLEGLPHVDCVKSATGNAPGIRVDIDRQTVHSCNLIQHNRQ